MVKATVKVNLRDHGGDRAAATLALVGAFSQALYGKPLGEIYGKRPVPVLRAGDVVFLHVPFWYCGSGVVDWGREQPVGADLENMIRHARSLGVQVVQEH